MSLRHLSGSCRGGIGGSSSLGSVLLLFLILSPHLDGLPSSLRRFLPRLEDSLSLGNTIKRSLLLLWRWSDGCSCDKLLRWGNGVLLWTSGSRFSFRLSITRDFWRVALRARDADERFTSRPTGLRWNDRLVGGLRGRSGLELTALLLFLFHTLLSLFLLGFELALERLAREHEGGFGGWLGRLGWWWRCRE